MNKKTPASILIGSLKERQVLPVLVVLLFFDVVFIALHFVWEYELSDLVNSSLFYLDEDRGYAEIYQYLKWFSVTVLFAYLVVARRLAGYAAWLLVFLYFLLDDALTIHEIIGLRLADSFHFTPVLGLRLRDVGELIVSSAAGIILLVVLGLAYLRGQENFRKTSRVLALLIAALVFFGVGVDMLGMTTIGSSAELMFVVFEDGGEMLVASVILSFVYWRCRRESNGD